MYSAYRSRIRNRRHPKFFNLTISDAEFNERKMKYLDEEGVAIKDKEFERKVRNAVKVWERKIKKGDIAGRIDENTVRPKKISDSESTDGTVYKKLDSDLKTIEAYVSPHIARILTGIGA